MPVLEGKAVVVVGGTGNVASFVVDAALQQGATVAVPSRARHKLDDLRVFLTRQGRSAAEMDRLRTFIGDVSDERQASELRERIAEDVGGPDAVLASLGEWRSAPSLLTASTADLDAVLQGYLLAHYKAAQTFLPDMKSSGGTYVSINGPLAFDLWPGTGSGLVSVVTAAQHMLFEALARELQESDVQVIELVSHAFIRNRQAQPGSPLSGEAVGAYAAHLLSGAAQAHGESIQLRSPNQWAGAGIHGGEA